MRPGFHEQVEVGAGWDCGLQAKFVPDGTDRVPEDAFLTVQGRAVYAADPGQFRRDRLDAVAVRYARIRDAYGR